MKKFLALLLALVMLFSLAACGENAETDPTTLTEAPTDGATEQPTEDATNGATENATDAPQQETEPAATQGQQTGNDSHTHSYTSAVTTAAGCTTNGVKTYNCSCGHSYSETISATGHSWGDWQEVQAATVTAEGLSQRTCGNCGTKEDKKIDKLTLPFDKEFSGGIALVVSSQDSSFMTADRMLNFCSYEIFHRYIYEMQLTPVAEQYKITFAGKTFCFNQYAVPEDEVFYILEGSFAMDDFTYDMLRASDRYDSATQTFLCPDPIWFTGYDSTVLAYEHLEGRDYKLYVEARVCDHPSAACSECATTDSCVIGRVLFEVIVAADVRYDPFIITFAYCNEIPDTATRMD